MGGGWKITLVLDIFLLTPEPRVLFFAWYGPGFFQPGTKQKSFIYISTDSDLEMDTRLIKSLVL